MSPLHAIAYYLLLLISLACPPLLVLTVPWTVILLVQRRNRRLRARMLEQHIWSELTAAGHANTARSVASTWRTS